MNASIRNQSQSFLSSMFQPSITRQIDDDTLAWWQKETAWNHIDSDGDLAWKDMSILYTS